ncbi:TetR/AcrR family transcriptional regulator [Aeromicrobium sp.]|uniref:TetR/AcrR family transcriptional regulator n=1 Tax=Aeromicrobium sp. TaxID=1871063 RepID=UPI002FC61FE0
MTTSEVASRRPSTQAERRAATRAALLDATITCLVEHGYTRTTTGRIAEAAGVSRGAQLRYFRNRADMVTAAVSRLATLRVESFIESIGSGPTSAEASIDALWEGHQGPLFDATLELWVAARTDPELRESLIGVERNVATAILAAARTSLPESSSRDGFSDDMIHVLATMRGLALLRLSSGTGPRPLTDLWPHIRAQLIALLS